MEDLQWEPKTKQVAEAKSYKESTADTSTLKVEQPNNSSDITVTATINPKQIAIIIGIIALLALAGVGIYFGIKAYKDYKIEHTGGRGVYNASVDAANEYMRQVTDVYNEDRPDEEKKDPIQFKKRDASQKETIDEKILNNILEVSQSETADNLSSAIKKGWEQSKKNFDEVKDYIKESTSDTSSEEVK